MMISRKRSSSKTARIIFFVIAVSLAIMGVMITRVIIVSKNNQNHIFQEPATGPPSQV